MRLREIVGLIGAEVDGGEAAQAAGDVEIRRVAKIEEAADGDITFVANPRYIRYLETTHASAVIVSKSLRGEGAFHPRAFLLRVDDPYLSFLKVLLAFTPPKDPLPPGIHATAVVSPGATLGNNVRIGAHVVVSEGCRIGDGTMIGHGTVLGENVEIGRGSLLYANVTVREGCRIGSRVVIHSGTVIGSDGFGFAPRADGTYEKIPQLGIVVIEDDVELGANCAVDRATMGETRIKRGVKLDNLIQVGHNVVIGESTVIAAQTGISGSTKVGRFNMIGGQVGFTGHLSIADNTKIGAQSGVHRSIEKPGTVIFGTPALPQRESFRVQGALTQLPDLLVTVRQLRQRIEDLERKLEQLRPGPERGGGQAGGELATTPE
jgi:UDP-3-O-[3-hydroxymyristoyl] glucosamine N-acyltransferase